MVLLAEHENVVETQFELVVLDLVKDSLAFVIKSLSASVEGLFELLHLVHKKFEYALDVFLFECELRVVQVHQSVALEDLEELIIEIVDQSSEKSDGPIVGIAVTASWSQLSELTKDLLDGLFDVLKIVGRQESVDWEVFKELVVVLGSLQLLFELRVEFESVNKLNLLRLSQKLLGYFSHVVVDLCLNVGQGSLNTSPEIDFLERRALLNLVVKLRDSSDISEPLGHSFL